jgi:Transcriptional regulatory protein, C terminal
MSASKLTSCTQYGRALMFGRGQKRSALENCAFNSREEMTKLVKYGKIAFESDFLFGTHDSGAIVKFTRAERIILSKLTKNSRSVISREYLLDAISDLGSDSTDRNIDFVINRLRRKLQDSARQPTYIGTQYGEGYIWIAERAPDANGTSGAFLVIGPVHGLKHLGSLSGAARLYANELRRRLDNDTASTSRVVLDEGCPPPGAFAGEKPMFAADLSFVKAQSRLDCAICLKRFATGEILLVTRLTVANDDPSGASLSWTAMEEAARCVSTAIWDALTYKSSAPVVPSNEPLPVRMHDAARLLADTISWKETERRLRSALATDPSDYRSQLMLAVCLHTKHVSYTLFPAQDDSRAQDESEMERLVLSSLPHLQDNPVFMMAAGKLLYFLGRGHRPLAIKILESAFHSTTALATSFATYGQMQMFEGDIDRALELYDQGLELSQDKSEFQIYLLVLKCEALLASGRRKALKSTLDVLYEKNPGTRYTLPLFFVDPEVKDIPPEAQSILDRLDEKHARIVLSSVNYICARLFHAPEHRQNILRSLQHLFASKFGSEIILEDPDVSSSALAATSPASGLSLPAND